MTTLASKHPLARGSTRLRQMIEHLPVGAITIEGEALSLNRVAEAITGYQSEEILTLDCWFATMYGDRAAEVKAYYLQQRQQGFPESPVLPLPRRDSTIRWVQFTALRDDDKELWLLHDITERKQAEEALHVSEERYALALTGSQDGLWDWDIRTGDVFFSDRWKSMIGYEPHELADNVDTWMALLHSEDRERVSQTLQDYFAQHASIYEIEFRCAHKEGGYRWILARGVARFDADGKPYRMAGSHTDITERKQAEQALREQQDFVERVANASPNILYIYDLTTHKNVYANRELIDLLGYSPETVQSLGDALLPAIFHPEDLPRIGAHHHQLAASADGTILEIEYRVKHASGTWHWMHSRDTPFSRHADGQVVQILGTAQDITERVRMQEELHQALATVSEQNASLQQNQAKLEEAITDLEAANVRLEVLATTDGLTGLTNHRTFQERLTREWRRARRSHAPLSVILLDVDFFKHYNDSFGHPAGDQVLRAVAQVLRQQVRPTDLAARYGGEEFVVLLPQTSAAEAIHIAERLRQAIADSPWPKRTVTASFGVASGQEAIVSPSGFLDAADKALYASKQRGRNCVTHTTDLTDEDHLVGRRDAQPYSDLLQQMLQAQNDMLVSASGQIKDIMVQTYDATIQSWARLLDLRDKETEGHSERVTEKMVALAHSLGLNPDEITYIRWGALLHDIGKMGVPDHILHKPGPLTDEEWVVMRRHTTLAYEMLWPIEFLRPAIDIPWCHHEKWDGTGYPNGLKGDDIPLAARLFALVDVWDALCSDRPYRKGWEPARVRAYLSEQAGSHFDPRAVRAFLRLLDTPQQITQLAA